jgi:hypothetical protein
MPTVLSMALVIPGVSVSRTALVRTTVEAKAMAEAAMEAVATAEAVAMVEDVVEVATIPIPKNTPPCIPCTFSVFYSPK